MGRTRILTERILLCGLMALLAVFAALALMVPSAQASMNCPVCGAAMSYQYSDPAYCEVGGTEWYICTNPDCPEPGTSYPQTTSPTGHNYSELVERVEPTCTSAGRVTYRCTNPSPNGTAACGATTTQNLAALGHSWSGWIVATPATETSVGSEYRTCSRCGARENRTIPMLQTADEEEEEEAEEEEEEEPAPSEKNEITVEDTGKVHVVWPWFVALAVFMGLALGMFLKYRKGAAAATLTAGAAGSAATAVKAVEAVTETTVAASSEVGLARAISNAFKNNPKTILLCVGENNVGGPLVRMMKGRHFLSIRSVDPKLLNSIPKEAADMKPDLIILHLKAAEEWARLAIVMERTREAYSKARFALLVSDPGDINGYEHLKNELESLKDNGAILAYVFDSEVETNGLVRLVLPLYKETIVSDNTPACIGIVADILGIPGVSTVVSTFTSGRQIKDVMAAGDLTAGDKALVIGDIAEALGLSNVVSIAALVDYANAIQRTATDKDGLSGKQ